MKFRELVEKQICDECGNPVVKIDDDTYYCEHCHAELRLCGMYGKCDGIAYTHPYVLEDGKLIEAGNVMSFGCDTCGEGGELA